ncbi:MAG: ectoine/hydroxyectoine ABC transporter substrate-binding protein EhuB [Mesorhizobium sp.]|uniref:ectoine/hydroxyectoine ABC transporter substrate-binding protein EhuB n=1 Tax=Mesorhizobium sp. TaxID=1871066 RepID=UPI000FEA91DB|nr:ectoine/hydroxyectoine ABC transporter substrate-binding protein EhuB [Mesorhizobium sp.]RWP56682.1 MAG: ectoine/hydroxyectoine ABC transporter substrate-binding protein EhuB [Mesorhizobium sp.]TIW69225.1 MAG: ectoine/hydroxyectoine ABC transporter substrate-binding protein EhuB [Mesorhizobium sp.]
MNGLTRRAVLVVSALAIALGMTTVVRAESTLDKIKSTGEMTAGVAIYDTWAFRRENGEVAGFSPDLIKAAFEPLGVKKFNFVLVEWGALVPSLQTHRFDLIAAGMWITPARCEMVAFSDPDVLINDAALVKKGNPNNIHSYEDVAKNPNLRIGAGRGSAALEHARMAGIPDDRILQFQDEDAASAALFAGRIDAQPLGSTSIGRVLKDPNSSAIIESATPFTGFIAKDGYEVAGRSAIAFRLDDKELRDVYNKRLAELKADGTVAALMKKYELNAKIDDRGTAERACKG